MKSLFSIFTETANSFQGKEDGENVLLLVRRHPFFISLRISFFVTLFILPVLIGAAFYSYLILYNLLGLVFFAYSLWCMLLWQLMFYSLTMYVLDVWIVTDKRIIDSTQRGFFDRSVSELHFERIQDISVVTSGLFQTFFNFGDLEIQTAGTENKFKFLQIPNPSEVKNQIMSHVSQNVLNKSVLS